MKKTLIATIVASTLAAGCSSPPKPVVPDGGDRTPINNQSKIEEYHSRVASDVSTKTEDTLLNRKVSDLARQMAELKAYFVMLQMEAEQKKAQTPKPAQEQPKKSVTVGTVNESVEVRDQSLVFRVTHETGKTEFDPSSDYQQTLLNAAKSSKHIEIRGRTDADKSNLIDRDIAMMRALKARRFLIKNGVTPSKIKWSSIAAGGYVVENKTPEGKAKNRRVEIETMDLDTTAFNQGGNTKVGSAQ